MYQSNKTSDLYCVAPWVNLHINTTAAIKPCCAWPETFNSAEKYIAGQEPKLLKLKQQLIDNDLPRTCQKCVERDWYSEFENTDVSFTDINSFELKSLDVRWGKTCQLNCMYCNSNFSSSWQQLNSKQKTIPIQNNRIKDVDLILNLCIQHNVKRVSLLGGEPLLLKENIQLLDALDNNVGIEIFTNLNVDLTNNQIYQRLIQRTNVNWYVSMENVGDKFEFVRRGANWKQQVSNLKQLVATNPKSVSLQAQYCVYSAFDLVDLFEFSDQLGTTVNLVFENFSPKILDIFSYPQQFKELALQEIDRCIARFESAKATLSPVRDKWLNSMHCVVPDIVEQCVQWHRNTENKYFNNKYDFVGLWTQFGKTAV